MQERNKRGSIGQKGFTLVELLIVVIILAVLAAIVVPQFTSSTVEARESALQTTLAEMRGAIELYYHQHGATYPGAKASTPAPGTGAANSAAAFIEQLTMYSDASGGVSNTKDATHKYGPYLKRTGAPSNPVDNSVLVTIATTGSLAATGNGTDGGWWFDTVSGKFVANVDTSGSGGKDYRTF